MEPRATSIKEGNISLVLDSYNDIFSDFDPRPYHQKAVSGDFLQECRNASRDKPEGGVELRLMVPKASRNTRDETLIRKRLRDHFKKHHNILHQDKKKAKTAGIRWIATGTAFSLLAVALHGYLDNFITTLLFVIVEPAGWFSIWTGFERIFLDEPHIKSERQFYGKMSRSDIIFESY